VEVAFVFMVWFLFMLDLYLQKRDARKDIAAARQSDDEAAQGIRE